MLASVVDEVCFSSAESKMIQVQVIPEVVELGLEHSHLLASGKTDAETTKLGVSSAPREH